MNRVVLVSTTTQRHRHLRGHDPSTRPRPSLSALRLPHGDHRDLRAGLSPSPPSLRAGVHNRDQLVVTLRAITSIAVVFSLPLLSAGNDGACPFPRFPTRFASRSDHHSLKFASQRALPASSRANHRQKRCLPDPALRGPNKTNPHIARG